MFIAADFAKTTECMYQHKKEGVGGGANKGPLCFGSIALY